ncbi:MAG: hypothetical protein GY820_04295 [Gammaproteobacteria bacterium]|nr:hypothetical protein [Gammaproteobacteria bacterium]
MAKAPHYALQWQKQNRQSTQKTHCLQWQTVHTKPHRQELQQQKCWTENSNLDAARITVASPFESKKVYLIELRSLSHQPAQSEQY